MTIGQAIAEADALWPNAYSTEVKARWVSRCESMVHQEILQLHEGYDPEDAYEATEECPDMEYELAAEEPHDVLYVYWLECQIHYADNETLKYNNARSMFNAALEGFRKHHARTHPPIKHGRFLF